MTSNKLRELMIYIALKCENDPYFGAVKLNKILFLIDFSAYVAWRTSITGSQYVAQEMGPVPQNLLRIRDDAIRQGDMTLRLQKLFGVTNPEHRLVALREPDLSFFSAREIALIDAIIERVSSLNGRQLSQWSHDFAGWKAAKKGDVIPYETALISSEPPTPYELQRTQELIQEQDW